MQGVLTMLKIQDLAAQIPGACGAEFVGTCTAIQDVVAAALLVGTRGPTDGQDGRGATSQNLNRIHPIAAMSIHRVRAEGTADPVLQVAAGNKSS